ncbi:MAG: hypothetical protein R3C01_13920 [Planctomycetaceae bacterium]
MSTAQSTQRRMLSVLAMVMLLVSGTGCTQLGLTALLKKNRMTIADTKHPVDEIISIWEVGEGRGLDGLPTRGFAGQLLFFTNGIDEPIVGNGDIRIYVFDDQGTEDEQTRPLHQFDFPAVAFNAFLREANIGPGYQIFIPYTRKGGHQAECSLRIRYTPVDGGAPVYSRMVSVVLPGRKTNNEHEGPDERQATTASQQFPGAIPNAADHGALTLDGLGGRPDLRVDRMSLAAKDLAASLAPKSTSPVNVDSKQFSNEPLPRPLNNLELSNIDLDRLMNEAMRRRRANEPSNSDSRFSPIDSPVANSLEAYSQLTPISLNEPLSSVPPTTNDSEASPPRRYRLAP